MTRLKYTLQITFTLALLSNAVAGDLSWNRSRGTCVDASGKEAHYSDLRDCGSAEGQNFIGVDLSGRNLTGARLKESNFARAVLKNVNFEGADLTDSNLWGAKDLSGARFSDRSKLPFDKNVALSRGMIEINYDRIDSELGYLVNSERPLVEIRAKVIAGAVPTWKYIYRHSFEHPNDELYDLLVGAGLDLNDLHETQLKYLLDDTSAGSKDDNGRWFLKMFGSLKDKNRSLSADGWSIAPWAIAVQNGAPLSVLEKMISMGATPLKNVQWGSDCFYPSAFVSDPDTLEFLVKDLQIPLVAPREACQGRRALDTAQAWFTTFHDDKFQVTPALLSRYEKLGGVFEKVEVGQYSSFLEAYLNMATSFPTSSKQHILQKGATGTIRSVIQFFLDRSFALEANDSEPLTSLTLEKCRNRSGDRDARAVKACSDFAWAWLDLLFELGAKFRDSRTRAGYASIQNYVCGPDSREIKMDMIEVAKKAHAYGVSFDEDLEWNFGRSRIPVFFGCADMRFHSEEKLKTILGMLTDVNALDKEGNTVWKMCNFAELNRLDSCVGPLLSAGVSLVIPNQAGQTPFQYLEKPVLHLLETKYGIKAPHDP